MAALDQSVWTWLPLSRTTGVGRAPMSAPPQSPHCDKDGDAEWLNSSGSNGRGYGSQAQGRHIGGRWVRVAYALIDVCCVVGNGVLAFLLRFSLDDPWHASFSGHLLVAT